MIRNIDINEIKLIINNIKNINRYTYQLFNYMK